MAKMDHGCSSFLGARSSMSKIMIVSFFVAKIRRQDGKGSRYDYLLTGYKNRMNPMTEA